MLFYASVAVNVKKKEEREEERGREIVDVKGGWILKWQVHINI